RHAVAAKVKAIGLTRRHRGQGRQDTIAIRAQRKRATDSLNGWLSTTGAAPKLSPSRAKEAALPAEAPRLRLEALGPHDCRWIDGDPKGDHSYCGAPVKPGTSWCPDHHARVWGGTP